MSVGPTIYPLVFAAIGGRCLRNLAVALAERGTTISVDLIPFGRSRLAPTDQRDETDKVQDDSSILLGPISRYKSHRG